MIAFMVFVTGAAVSLAVFFLGRGFAGFTPEFDRETVDRVGLIGAFALFCGSGPVLLARSIDQGLAERHAAVLFNTVLQTLLLLLWTGVLGIVAVESTRMLL
ncbi:MAG: hypothetical protein CL535_03940 [Ahrensia sp.]|nr:hypothetical protein [Ahrensia sp.]|tara:strand:+ start:23357 stop:23662 length:306 start_codon:yes stop_codon:yes gene_type:complete